MKNAVKRNDIHNDDLEVTASSTFLNHGITSLAQLKDWILTKLGYPLITVELTPSQLDSCIADAVQQYTKYEYHPENYLVVNTRFYEPTKGLDLKEFNIMSVKQLSYQRDNVFGLYGGDMFFSPYAAFGQGVGSPMFGLNGNNWVGSWVTYHNIHEWFELSHRMTGSNPDFRWDKVTKRLQLMPEPTPGKDHFILLTVNQELPLDEYYGNQYVKDLALAEAKILLGTIRKKFSSVQLIGGGSVDTTIGDEGREEKQRLLDEIIKSESCGQCCYVM